MEKLRNLMENRITELYNTLSFALPGIDYQKLLTAYHSITDLVSVASLSDLPYRLFQLTYSPDPFTRILASGVLSIHFELDKKHPIYSLTQALEIASHHYKGDPDLLYSYIISLLDSPDLATLIRRMERDLPNLPDDLSFVLTSVVVKCLPEVM